MAAGTSRNGDRTRSRVAILLLALAASALLVRVVAIAEPLGIDQSLWASAVYGMAQGQTLYVDVWEQRPPGIYLTYLAGFSVFGWTEGTVAWLDIIAAVCTTLLLWGIGRRLADNLTGALAAALYAVLTIPAGLYGYGGFLERSVCETFIVVCAGAAALGAARLRDDGAAPWALAVGLAGGLAALYKPNAALYLPAVMVWWVWMLPAARRSLTTVASLAGVMLAGAAAPLVVTGAWLWQIGAIDEARIAVVDFNRYYVTEGLATPAHALAFANGVWLRMKTDPVWAGGGLTSLVACWSLIRTRTLAPLPALALCWGAAATVVILVNGIRLFNSYFLQAYAPLCLMAAWWLADRRGSTGRRLAQGAVGLVMFVLLVSGVYPVRATERTLADWRRLTGQIGQTDYLHGFGGYANARGYSARANQEVADYIRSRTSEHDSIFLFGVNGAGIYFLAERITAHRFIRVNFFFPDGFPDPRFTVEAVTADLARRRPRYVLFEDLHASSAIGRAVSGVSTHPAVVGLLGDYEFETQIEDFAIYRRR